MKRKYKSIPQEELIKYWTIELNQLGPIIKDYMNQKIALAQTEEYRRFRYLVGALSGTPFKLPCSTKEYIKKNF